MQLAAFTGPHQDALFGGALLLKERLKADLEGLGDAKQGGQGRDDLFVFDLGQERLGKSGRLGDVLQGQPPFLTQPADLQPDAQLFYFLPHIFHQILTHLFFLLFLPVCGGKSRAFSYSGMTARQPGRFLGGKESASLFSP